MVQRVAAVDEVDRIGAVLVGQKARLDAVDVAQALTGDRGLQRGEHDRRDVDGDDAFDRRRADSGELAGAGTDVDDDRIAAQSRIEEHRQLGLGLRVLLDVVARDVSGIEILPTRVRDLIGYPAGVSTEEHRQIMPKNSRVQGPERVPMKLMYDDRVPDCCAHDECHGGRGDTDGGGSSA